jgi:ATP-binding cassette ChvD family protein
MLNLNISINFMSFQSSSYIYNLIGLNKETRDGKLLFQNVFLSFFYYSRIGIVGKNGSGKSTLLKIMAGLDTQYAGEALPAKGIRIGYLPQEPHFDPQKTVREVIEEGVQDIKTLIQEFEALAFAMCTSEEEFLESLMEQQGHLQEKIDAADGWELELRLNLAMEALGCPPGDRQINTLSGGEKRRVALCRLLLSHPDLLLLDEPTNHLDTHSVAWLENYLKTYKGTVIVVTHDRYFLDNVVDWILELDKGEALPFKGNYSAWLTYKVKRWMETKSKDNQLKIVDRELKWLSYAQKAKNEHNQERIKAYETRLERTLNFEQGEIVIPEGPRLGQKVIEFHGVTKSYGNRTLIQDLTFHIQPGAIIGIIGANGMGKTTLFRLITEQEKPDSGKVDFGSTVHMGYVDQERDKLRDDETVWEAISGQQEYIPIGKNKILSRVYCAGFQFCGQDQQKLVGKLSGGERNRVHMARMLKGGHNVLLLDEPTNDLDVGTIRALEEAILNFSGSLLVISHDRYFLDRLATHILAFEGDGQVRWFQGNYSMYREHFGDVIKNTGKKTQNIKFH